MVKIEKEKIEEIKTNNSEVKYENSEAKLKKFDLSKLRENPWMISTFVFVALSVILLIIVLGGNGLTGNAISEASAAQQTQDFVKKVYGIDLIYKSGEEKNGVYNMNFDMDGQDIKLGATKDFSFVQLPTGSWLRVEDYENLDLSEQEETQETEEIPKTDKPVVDLYVMSFCPYGNKAEDTMLPVYNLLKSKVDFNVHYIVSVSGSNVQSLHGQPEVDQNEREACVMKEYGEDKLWSFMTAINANCGSSGSCWEAEASKLGIDANKIKSCVSSSGLSLMQANADASDAAGASGSPTLIINGVESTSVYQYGNSEGYKTAICSAFNTEPSECSQTLGSSTSTSAGGSC